MVTKLRADLRAIRSLLAAGETAEATLKLDETLESLGALHLLTTSEAAEILGIRSVNTLKALVRTENIPVVMHGNRMMIPLAEVERIQEGTGVRGIRAADIAHDAAEALGGPDGLSQEEMDALSASRPGTPPWQSDPTASGQRQSA